MREPIHIPRRRSRALCALLSGLLMSLGACDRAEAPGPVTEGATGDPTSETPTGQKQALSPPRLVGASWTGYRGDPALTGVAEASLPDEPVLLWSYATGGAIVSSPVVSDGRVYVGSDDGGLYCLDLMTGKKQWVHQTELLIEAPPFLHGGTVYVGSHDFWFYAVDAETGELRWKVETNEKIVGGATVVTGPDGGDLIVFGSHDAMVYAVDAETGDTAWTFETADRVNATPAVHDNAVVFGGCDTGVYVIDGATGRERSKVMLGGECHIAASAGVKDGHIYLGHHANEFISLDLESGEIVWGYPNERFGFFSPPAITEEHVFFGGRDRNLHCVDRATGEAVWSFETRRKIDAGPVVAGDKVVVGSGDGRLYIVARDSGDLIWSTDIGKSIFSSPAVVGVMGDPGGAMFLVGANDGSLYAFGPESLRTTSNPQTAQANEANDG
jgi:outer membrane protein assembly factor BamB